MSLTYPRCDSVVIGPSAPEPVPVEPPKPTLSDLIDFYYRWKDTVNEMKRFGVPADEALKVGAAGIHLLADRIALVLGTDNRVLHKGKLLHWRREIGFSEFTPSNTSEIPLSP